METKEKTNEKIIKILFKESFLDHTASSLAQDIGISRQGVWKILNKLSKQNLIYSNSIANTKKSASNITLNLNNSITEKTLSLILEKEALNYERWRDNLNKLEKYVSFLILFGSILHSPKEANDIDILIVAKTKNEFKAIEKIILEIQQIQLKRIHVIDLTKNEFKIELKNKNKAYIEALKKGVVLFGHDEFIKFIKELKKE